MYHSSIINPLGSKTKGRTLQKAIETVFLIRLSSGSEATLYSFNLDFLASLAMIRIKGRVHLEGATAGVANYYQTLLCDILLPCLALRQLLISANNLAVWQSCLCVTLCDRNLSPAIQHLVNKSNLWVSDSKFWDGTVLTCKLVHIILWFFATALLLCRKAANHFTRCQSMVLIYHQVH